MPSIKDATDVKFAPVRGDKSDVRLEEMFKQIIERVEDLQAELLMCGSFGVVGCVIIVFLSG